MAVYRNVHLSFWTDNKVEDDFTPEDKYFYLYLLTNPQTNICGCYEVSYNQMTQQTGYNKDTINRLLDRFENVYRMIRFDSETKEILILNWFKYNWSKSEKTLVGVEKSANHIKSESFRNYVFGVVNSIRTNTPYMGHTYTMQASDTDTVSNNNIVSNYPSVDNDNLSNNFSFNAEKAWNDTFAIYPKKDGFATAKQIWMDKLLGVVPENQYDVAVLIAKAVKAYLSDYELKHPNLENYKYARRFDKWLTEDCDYWISQVEKGE